MIRWNLILCYIAFKKRKHKINYLKVTLFTLQNIFTKKKNFKQHSVEVRDNII